MEKEDIVLVAQLIEGMSETIDKLENAKNNKDLAEFRRAKNTFISFQEDLDKII